jgi:hypothetical protein
MSEKNVSVSKTTHRAGIAQAALPAAAGPSYCHHVVQPLRMFPITQKGVAGLQIAACLLFS